MPAIQTDAFHQGYDGDQPAAIHQNTMIPWRSLAPTAFLCFRFGVEEKRGHKKSLVPLLLLLTAGAMASYLFGFATDGDLTGDGRFSIADIKRVGWLLIVLPAMVTVYGLGGLMPGLIEFFEIDRLADGSFFWVVFGLLLWLLYAALLASIENGMVRPATRWFARRFSRCEPEGQCHIDINGIPHRRIGER